MSKSLNPQWIVGFVDGEGCFHIDVHRNKDCKWGLQIQPEFTVVQHERDQPLLQRFIQYFGCGNVTQNRQDETSCRVQYRVKNLKALLQEKSPTEPNSKTGIIPFFVKHRLQTKKNIEFRKFRKVCLNLDSEKHLKSLSDFLDIVEKARSMRLNPSKKRNSGRSDGLEQHIEKLKTIRDLLKDQGLLGNPEAENAEWQNLKRQLETTSKVTYSSFVGNLKN